MMASFNPRKPSMTVAQALKIKKASKGKTRNLSKNTKDKIWEANKIIESERAKRVGRGERKMRNKPAKKR